jgi:hypothetical protein
MYEKKDKIFSSYEKNKTSLIELVVVGGNENCAFGTNF